jgi:trigger factor
MNTENIMEHPKMKAAAEKLESVLENLEVVVSAPQPVTERDILVRLDELRYAHATRRPRAATERIAMGDEVVVNMVGYVNGRVVPFTARHEARFRVLNDQAWPALVAGLLGAPVAGLKRVRTELPTDFRVTSLRGSSVEYVIDVVRCHELTVPAPSDAAFIASLELGDTLQGVFEQLACLLMEERLTDLEMESQRKVLTTLGQATEIKESSPWITDQIRALWEQGERPALIAMGVPEDQFAKACQAWEQDAELRNDARNRLSIGMALHLVESGDTTLGEPDWTREIERAADEVGVNPAQVASGMREDDADTISFVDHIAMRHVVDHVMSHAVVRVAEA